MNKLDLTRPEDRLFPKILRRQAQENGATPFLLSDTLRITFAEADELTDRLAMGLQLLGVGSGDRVGLYLGNRPEFVLLTLAVNKLGAIWVPVNTDYKGEWLLDSVLRSRCQVFITESEFLPRLQGMREQLDIAHWVLLPGDDAVVPENMQTYAQLATSARLHSDYAEQTCGDTCAILWTSGTTGKSKGVMQNSNGWIRAIFQGASPMFDSRPGDVIYCVLPLFNTGAWITAVYRALLEGLPCVIETKFSVSHFWQRIAHFQATQTFLMGAMGVFLWNAPASAEDAQTTLRKAMIVPFAADIWVPFEQRFGLQIITGGLGMSECQLVANQLAAKVALPPYSLGYAAEDIELRLCDDHGHEVAVGEAGEICIKPLAPYVLFNGYFDDPEATAASWRGEFFLTGDMARRDPATGALFFVDRKKDAVRFAGRNISTLEVESVARRHPAIADVAAFGITSELIDSEQELKLDVVLKADVALTAEALCEFINANAPHYFVPRYIDFVASLPYTPTNKVQKYKLRDRGVGATTWDLQRSSYQVQR